MTRRIEIGSGTRPMADAFHVDINSDLPQIDLVAEMDDLSAIPDASYDELYAVHVIEHVPIFRARRALEEWCRVLAPGGRAHIDTPNFQRNIELYQNDTWYERDFRHLHPEEQARLKIDGKPDKDLWLNFKQFSTHNLYDIHYWNASPNLLSTFCRKAGFSRVEVHQTDPSLIVHAWK